MAAHLGDKKLGRPTVFGINISQSVDTQESALQPTTESTSHSLMQQHEEEWTVLEPEE